MKLEHLKEQTCTICEALPEREYKGRQHTNGNWNEEREFACGRAVGFSPNFNEVEVKVECPNTLEEKIKFSNRKDASLKLENYIYKLKVDEEFKDKLIENIRFVIYDYR
jgi:predicted transcriptional regulator